MNYRKYNDPTTGHYGFTSTVPELEKSFGPALFYDDRYVNASVVEFETGSRWLRFHDTGLCFKPITNPIDAGGMEAILRCHRTHHTLKWKDYAALQERPTAELDEDPRLIPYTRHVSEGPNYGFFEEGGSEYEAAV